MGRQEDLRALCLTIEGDEGYDGTKPRSQLAFGRLLGFTIGGGDPRGERIGYMGRSSPIHCLLFTSPIH